MSTLLPSTDGLELTAISALVVGGVHVETLFVAGVGAEGHPVIAAIALPAGACARFPGSRVCVHSLQSGCC